MSVHSFKYDGIAVIEIKLDSTQRDQPFPATTTLDNKMVVAIEAYTDAVKTPNQANMIGTTNSGAALVDSYLTINDNKGNKRIDNYPVNRMKLLATGLGAGPLVFEAPFEISWADSKLTVGTPGTNLTTGEAAVFYVYYRYK